MRGISSRLDRSPHASADRPAVATSLPTVATDTTEKAKLEKTVEMRLESAPVPPKINSEAALTVARTHIPSFEEVLATPRASHWLATNAGQATERAVAGEEPATELFKFQKRPVWIVTYDEVRTLTSGPADSTDPHEITARVDMLIDATTGEWLLTSESEVGP